MAQDCNQLIKDEKALMETVSSISRKVVSRYVARAVVPLREKEDVEMAVIEKFLKKKDKIINDFIGKSKLTTYCTAIINRMCCEIIRKEQKHWYSVSENEQNASTNKNTQTLSYEAEKPFVISSEVKRLTKAMFFFNGINSKVNLFLKYYYDIPLNDNDIINYSKENINFLKEILAEQQRDSKSDKFEKLAIIVNKTEGKNIKGDAVRMWLNKQINILLKRLNNNNASNHNAESLGILFEIKEAETN